MPVPADNVKLIMIFALNDGSADVEVAECGIWGMLNGGSGAPDYPTQLQALAVGALAAWTAHAPVAEFSSAVVLKQAKAVHYNTSGHTLAEGVAAPTGTPWQGTASQSLPWEVSLCLSLYGYNRGTFEPNAARKRNRTYLPPMGAVIMGNAITGRLSATNANAVLTWYKAFLADVSSVALGSSWVFAPQVLSKGGTKPPLDPDGTLTAVQQISVDDKLDSQRRRERQQPATIYTLAFP